MMTLTLALLACDTHTLEFKDTGEDLSCGPGTHEENGVCLPDQDTGDDSDLDPENTAPSAPLLAITPDLPTQLSDLSCRLRSPSIDAEGDDVSYDYVWLVDGVESGFTGDRVPESATARGERWTCRVTPSDGALEGPSAEVSVTLDDGYSELALGVFHVCGLVPDNVGEEGPAVCWGGNSYGEGTPPSVSFKNIYAGYYESCGQDASGALQCWGTVSWGMDTPPSGRFDTVDLGWSGAYAVAPDGSLSPWGYASDGPTGSFLQVASGEYDYCALDVDGRVQCWGVNPNGEGNPPSGEFTTLVGGYHNFCVLDAAGYPSCWGFREEINAAPREVLADLAAYDGNACGIRGDGSLSCWGDDEVLVADTPAGTFAQVSLGGGAACALDAEGRASCWGSYAVAPPSR
jgi:Regulator of chromosome condensation (RCC1) repeat